MNLNKGEKVIYKITSPVSILEQQKYVPCNIIITNKRFLIERDGILKDFKLIELESFIYIKNLIYKSGLQLKLKNGFTYDLALTKPDSLLQKIEAVISKKIPESDKPISNKAANAMIILGLIAISIPILYFTYSAYDNFKFNTDPIQYIENSSELSDDVNYRSNDLVGYPYLHGTWEYYDTDSADTRRLLVMMYDDGEYKKGRYIVMVRDELYEGKDFSVTLEGEFTLKKGKNLWGDEKLIAHDKKLLKELSRFENSKYPFLISTGDIIGSRVQLGPSAGAKGSATISSMKKISNKSFNIPIKSNSSSSKNSTSSATYSQMSESDSSSFSVDEKVIPPPPPAVPAPEIVEVIEDEEEIEEIIIESSETDLVEIEEIEGNTNYKFSGQDFYIIAEDIASSEEEAKRLVEILEYEGFEKTGYLWIPDYKSLSGAEYYSVFIGPFLTIEECALEVERYRKSNPSAYGLLVSNKSTERVEIRGPGKITRR